MNAPDTLRAAAHTLSGRKDLKHANALAGLLQNRADDMEHNIAIWQCTKRDVPTLIEKHYGIYLTVATAVLLHPCTTSPASEQVTRGGVGSNHRPSDFQELG
jgi:hypothetical protein